MTTTYRVHYRPAHPDIGLPLPGSDEQTYDVEQGQLFDVDDWRDAVAYAVDAVTPYLYDNGKPCGAAWHPFVTSVSVNGHTVASLRDVLTWLVDSGNTDHVHTATSLLTLPLVGDQ